MNIAMRKLAMMEKNMEQQEEEIRTLGYSSVPFDQELKNKITYLMDKVRTI